MEFPSHEIHECQHFTTSRSVISLEGCTNYNLLAVHKNTQSFSCLPVFKIFFVNLTHINYHCIGFLFFISLISCEVAPLLICLLAIHVLSSGNTCCIFFSLFYTFLKKIFMFSGHIGGIYVCGVL